MKKFITSLGGSSGVVTPPTTPIVTNPSEIIDKIYWWIDAVDQINSLDLINDGDRTSIPYNSDTKKATEVISLNTWFTGITPQIIDRASIVPFCGGRQFYNFSTKELIILKAGQHLTADEETGLLNYLEIASTLHEYHANTLALFTRFTNSYTSKEKSRIDNVMRLLVASGIYSKLDHFYLSCTSKKQEQLLDWVSSSSNLEVKAENCALVPYRGLAPQTGYIGTNANPTTDVNVEIDNAFVSIKCFQDFEFNSPNFIFGADGDANFRYRPVLYGTTPQKGYEMKFFTNSSIYFPLGTSKYNDTNVMTKISGTFKSFRNGILKHTVATAGTPIMANSEVVIGGKIADRQQSHPQNIQHLAWGSGLTDTEGAFLSTIIDNFCYGQSAMDLGYIQEDGYKVYTYEIDIKDAMGNKCLYQKMDGIYFSEDLAVTSSAFIAFPYNTYGNIEMCHIFDDGRIIFATNKNQVFKTTEDLLSITEIFPTKNGAPYTIHTPVSGFYPGEYFKYLAAKNKQYLNDGTEIIVWGSYCNVWGGASPLCIWYSFGDEIKVAYEYGQNPFYTDTGTFVSGTGGVLLGDPSATIKTRHSHGVQQAPENKNLFFALQGDFDRAALTDVNGSFPAFFESGFVKLIYDDVLDTWTATLELTGTGNSRAKSSAAQMPGDGYLYYASDLSVVNPVTQFDELGFFKVLYDEVGDWSKHERFHLHEQLTRSLNHFHLDDEYFFMGAGYAAGGQAFGLFGDPDIIYSPDMVNYFERVLPIPGNSYFYKITKIASKKYLFNAMVTYNYQNSLSVMLDFN
jgi:hypothetical protein